MKALVHIGPTKTGSASLQRFLATHADALAGRGLRYQRWEKTQHLDSSQIEVAVAALADANRLIPLLEPRKIFNLGSGENTRAMATAWLAWLDSHLSQWTQETVIFSSEQLMQWLRTKDVVTRLDRLLQARFDQVEYVTYLRPQEDWMLNQYAQSLRAGSKVTLRDEVETRLARVGFDMPDYAARLRPWVDAIGKDRLSVRLLDPETLRGGDLALDVIAMAGLDTSDLAVPPPQNQDLGTIASETIRQLNLRFPIFGKGTTGHNAARLQLVRHLADSGVQRGDTPLHMPKDLRARIQITYGKGNEWLAKTFPDTCAGLPTLSDTEGKNAPEVTEAQVINRLAAMVYAQQTGEIPPLDTRRAQNSNKPRNYMPPPPEAWL